MPVKGFLFGESILLARSRGWGCGLYNAGLMMTHSFVRFHYNTAALPFTELNLKNKSGYGQDYPQKAGVTRVYKSIIDSHSWMVSCTPARTNALGCACTTHHDSILPSVVPPVWTLSGNTPIFLSSSFPTRTVRECNPYAFVRSAPLSASLQIVSLPPSPFETAEVWLPESRHPALSVKLRNLDEFRRAFLRCRRCRGGKLKTKRHRIERSRRHETWREKQEALRREINRNENDMFSGLNRHPGKSTTVKIHKQGKGKGKKNQVMHPKRFFRIRRSRELSKAN